MGAVEHPVGLSTISQVNEGAETGLKGRTSCGSVHGLIVGYKPHALHQGIDAGWRLSFDAAVEEARSVVTRFPSLPLPWFPFSTGLPGQPATVAGASRVAQQPALMLPFERLSGSATFSPVGSSGSSSLDSSTRVEAAGSWGASSGLSWPQASSGSYLGLAGSLSFWAGSSSSGSGGDLTAVSPLLLILAAVPKLSSEEDREQVGGEEARPTEGCCLGSNSPSH